MVAESVKILRETYLAILLDRDSNGPMIVASAAGGTDIEEVSLIFTIMYVCFIAIMEVF